MHKFVVVLTEDEADPKILNVTVPALPGCLTHGVGRKDALKNAKEAIELFLSVAHRSEVLRIQISEIEIDVLDKE